MHVSTPAAVQNGLVESGVRAVIPRDSHNERESEEMIVALSVGGRGVAVAHSLHSEYMYNI